MPRRFTNLDPTHRPPGAWDVFRWAVWHRLTRRRQVRPPGPPAERVEPDLASVHAVDGPPRLTWIGHSSFLISLTGEHVLVDPVFSPRIGMFYKRHVAPGLAVDQLPPVSAVLVSHNHYDHLDAGTIDALSRSVRVIVPPRLGGWFRRRGFADVEELGWWESATVGDVRITATPARHWSRRKPIDGNRSWWCGYVLQAEGATIYHAGDTAWFDQFTEIGERYSEIDAALLPVGGYEPAWFMDRNHMNPEQAGRAFLNLGAQRLIPMHWGTFQMTDEPLAEPVQRLQTWWTEQAANRDDRQLLIPRIGETIALDG